MAKIVVGVDASLHAKAALEWAAAEARLRQAVVQVVHAYHSRELAAPAYAPTEHGVGAVVRGEPFEQRLAAEPDLTATPRDRAKFEDVFRVRADQLLDAVLRELGEALTGVEVQRAVIENRHPAEALLELSSDADLLVVGSRGHGGFSQLLLGSVSHAVVLHAACPVVVVRPRSA
ncbi:MAG TPA: universal stress protein [Mycobacteriales bacterium]